ncbi:MAG: phage terminase large subunit [Bacteroidota bacterium]
MSRNIKNELSRLRREEGSKSILAFARLYLSHYLEFTPSEAHREIYDLLLSASNSRGKKIGLAGPRGFGKTVLVNLIYILFSICYNRERFIMILSGTSSQANQMLDNIKKEFMENSRLRMDFPELFELKLLRLRHSDIITRNGIQIQAFGVDQPVRGRRFGSARPSLVVSDDMENPENVYSVTMREKLKDFYEKSVLQLGSEKTNYIFVGNCYHPHCLLSEYVNPDLNPAWVKKVYQAVIEFPENTALWESWSNVYNYKDVYKGKSGPEAALWFYEDHKEAMDKGAKLLWPERYSLYKLMVLKEDNPFSFMSEMQNSPIDQRGCYFNMQDIMYWDEDDKSVDELVKSLGSEVEFYGACDPSLGMNDMKGDYSAIVILAKDKKTNAYYIVVADIRRRPFEDIVEDILAYQLRYHFVKFGIEANQFQRVLIDAVEKKAREDSITILVEGITNTENKIARIQSLRMWIKKGGMQLSKKHRLLLEQFLYFPKGKYDDGIDALAMLIRLVDKRVEFSYGFAGGEWPCQQTAEEALKEAMITPAPDALVPYGWWGWHRRG